MSLPNQLKSARMTDSTVGSAIDDHVGDLEQALCDIFGITIDTNVTESPLELDNAGRITKQLLRLVGAAGVGIRFRDTTNSKEVRLSIANDVLYVAENTGTEGSPVWTNRLYIVVADGRIQQASYVAPTDNKHFTPKQYVDGQITAHTGGSSVHASATNLVKTTGDQSVGGKKTFTTLPEVSADPTTSNQLCRKSYVDGRYLVARMLNNDAQSISSGVITVVDMDVEHYDPNNICDLGNNRIVPNKSGYYLCMGTAGITFYSEPGVGYTVYLYVNGSEIARGGGYAGDWNTNSPNVVTFYYFNGSSDYLDLRARHDTGHTESIDAWKARLELIGPFN